MQEPNSPPTEFFNMWQERAIALVLLGLMLKHSHTSVEYMTYI